MQFSDADVATYNNMMQMEAVPKTPMISEVLSRYEISTQDRKDHAQVFNILELTTVTVWVCERVSGDTGGLDVTAGTRIH
jgi:hypothetical protein